MNGDNLVESGGVYLAGFLSQVNDFEKMVNNICFEIIDKTNIVIFGENVVGVFVCLSFGEFRICVDVVDDEVSDFNSYEVISCVDLKMNGGFIIINGINSYGVYVNGKKVYINLDYVVFEIVVDGSYVVVIR